MSPQDRDQANVSSAPASFKDRLLALWERDSAPEAKEGGEEAMLKEPIPLARSRFAFFLFAVAIVAIVGRSFYLQCGSKRDMLIEQADKRQYSTLIIPARRGQILDRNGKVLASSVPTKDVMIDLPNFSVKRGSDGVAALAKSVGMAEDELRARLAKKRPSYFSIAQRAPLDEAARIQQCVLDNRIRGVRFEDSSVRIYPAGETVAHVVGLTNFEGHGQEGMERAADARLFGVPGLSRVLRDAKGRTLEEPTAVRPPKAGEDVRLSIDVRLQTIAMKKLKETIEYTKAKAGAVLVADIHTGEILTLCNWPSYDPNDRGKMDMNKVRNRAITDMYEPGSIMKPFAVAKGLDMGLVRADTKIDTSPGRIKIADKTIGDTHNYGTLTVSQVISKSSNIGTLKIAQKMDAKTLWEMYTRAGFGQKPNIGFGGASAGMLRPYRKWGPVEHATISYGQGVSASLLQMVRAYTALARNGDVIDLTLLYSDKPAQGSKVFKPEIAKLMRSIMMNTVQVGGTARRVNVDGYTIAGKTGTANKVGKGGYIDKYVASFVGIAPATKPRIVAAVMIDEPQKGRHHGGVATPPVFNEITAQTLRLLNVNPDAPIKADTPAKDTKI